MELKNMKLTPKDRAEEKPEMSALNHPVYPYGLCLCLDEDVLEKLGLSVLPTVGDEMMVTAVAKVESVSQSDSASGKRRSLSLQITAMALGPKETTASAGAKLYSGT